MLESQSGEHLSQKPCRSVGAGVKKPSQRSPTPSPSLSSWLTLATVSQLSQASPTPSPSKSSWSGFETVGQLS